jgi:HPt (histidine-containing phosphotransfer) domain-containing protein
MREDKVAAAKARMAELAAKFVDRTAGELESMRGSLAKLQAGDIESLSNIRYLAHRMCGTGATLGFEGLSDCAARIESLADKLVTGPTPDASALTQLGVDVDALGAELARLRA